jgi:hypothetical protein
MKPMKTMMEFTTGKRFTVLLLAVLGCSVATFGSVIEIGPGTGSTAVDKPFCGG